MTGLYKLIFDLAVYYSLTGFYLNIFLKVPASAVGFGLLCLMVAGYRFARYQNAAVWLRRAALVLPALIVVFPVAPWSIVHMLPMWVYLGWCLEKRHVAEDYDSFRYKVLFGIRLQLLCLPGILLSNAGKEALLSSLPYLLVLLTVGICCLRCLRQGTPALRAGLLTGAFLAICLLLTVGGVPEFLMQGLRWFYNVVIVWLLQAAGTVLLVIITFVVNVIADLSRLKPTDKQQIADMESGTAQQLLGITADLTDAGDGTWASVIGYLIVGVAVIAGLVWLVIRLLGSLETAKPVTVVYSQEAAAAKPPQTRQRLIKPRDPRGKVRYYYALFLRECKVRGMEISPGSTGEELAQQCTRYFPEADPRDLAAIYAPARYCNTQPVTEQQAELAAKVWNRLRKTKYKSWRG